MSLLLAIIASAWTNVAGNVISAEPLRIEKTVVVMVIEGSGEGMSKGSGEGMRDEGRVTTNRYPLAAFPAAEQRRMRLVTGDYELPRKAADVRAVLADGLARAEARAKAGRMTPEALQAKRARTAAAWAHELEKTSHGLTPEEIEYWKGKIGK